MFPLKFIAMYRGYDIWESFLGTLIVTVGQGEFYGLEVAFSNSITRAKDTIDSFASEV